MARAISSEPASNGSPWSPRGVPQPNTCRIRMPRLKPSVVVSCTDSFHGTDVLAVSEHGAPGRRPNIYAHFVGRQREDGLDTLPARAAEANRSTLIADIPFPAWKRRSQAVRRARRPRARHPAVQARSGAGGKRFRTPTRIRSLPDQATEHLRRYRFARFTTAWIEPSRLWGTPYRKSVTFSDSGAHAIHLKSSSSDLVADEKAFSDRARAGDAVRPAQLLRDRRHHRRPRRHHLVSLPPASARAGMDLDGRVRREGSALESLGGGFPGPTHAGGPGPLHDVLRGRHSLARAGASEDLRRRGDRDLVG